MSAGKVAGTALFVAMFGAFFVDSNHGVFAGLRIGFWVTLGAHFLEAAVYLPRMRAAEGSTFLHVLQTLLFGFFHVSTLPKQT